MQRESFLRRALRQWLGPAPKQEISVVVSPGTVIRPGDTVLLCIPGCDTSVIDAYARKNWLPEGARVVVFGSDGASFINLSAVVNSVLNPVREKGDGHGSDDRPGQLDSPPCRRG